jgi:hypothetical protein
MNIGDSVNDDFKDKGHKLWLNLDCISQKQFFFPDWLTIQRTLYINELIPLIHSEIIGLLWN